MTPPPPRSGPGGGHGEARPPDLRDRLVVVAGLGVSGVAAAEVLLRRGARVVAVDGRDDEGQRTRAEALTALGARVELGASAAAAPPEGTHLVVTSPGWRPDSPLLAAAARGHTPVWGEAELAWRLRDPGVPWLALTGTNGKTTTVRMLAAMLAAAGLRTIACGNVGTPLVAAVTASPAYDVLAVELSSFQLHWSGSLRPKAAAILNLAPDHLDWHGSFEAYAAAKARIWALGGTLAVVNRDDPEVVRRAPAGSLQAGFSLARPDGFGVLRGVLVDDTGAELAAVADVRPAGPHNVANALAAAALARAHGATPAQVRAGLTAYTPDAHRNQLVATVDGVAYVDDSKATNPHAAAASLAAYEGIVWVAGGLGKGLDVEDLVRAAAPRLRAAVLIGTSRDQIGDAVARHAPQIPVIRLPGSQTALMATAVEQARGLARPGDTVLLAPAAASMDMFVDYRARGEAFAAAVRRLSSS